MGAVLAKVVEYIPKSILAILRLFLVYPVKYIFLEPIVQTDYNNNSILGWLKRVFILSPFGVWFTGCALVALALVGMPLFGILFIIGTIIYGYLFLFKMIKERN